VCIHASGKVNGFNAHCSAFTVVSEMTYTVSSGTLNSTIPYLSAFTNGMPHLMKICIKNKVVIKRTLVLLFGYGAN